MTKRHQLDSRTNIETLTMSVEFRSSNMSIGSFSARNLHRAPVTLILLAASATVQWPTADGANILAVETMAGKSHWNFMSAILGALLDDGHRVTAFTMFADGDRENYTTVDISGDISSRLDVDLSQMIDMYGGLVTTIRFMARMARPRCDVIHRNGRMREILRRGPAAAEFDVILVEPLFLDCVSHLAAELDVPIMYVVPYALPTFLERTWLGHVPNAATVSHLMAQYGSAPKTFVQRFTNTVMLAYSSLVLGFYDKWFRYTDPKTYDKTLQVSPSLIFVNSHYITEASRPLHPNVIHVGGIHLTGPKSIPYDILQFIEDSPHGVILFTFGSTTKMSTVPEHVQTAFKEALAQVPQRILWKYEGEMKNKPDNVMIKSWLPQRDILVHPKVKLFISHGGISGVYEAVEAGVPVLGFPLFGDQPRNIANLVDNGMAIGMDLLSVSKDSILQNVLHLLNDKMYKNNAEFASKLLKDRPMTPAQSVVYWTDYVIRHKGAPHLKSQALNLAWYQYLMLDVIGVALIICLAILFLFCTFSKILYLSIKSLRKQKVKTV